MKQDLAQEIELRRYLLADLTLEEQVLVEQRLFLDSDYSELAQAVENDLIDEYVHDDLVASEREKFESHFLNQPEHRGDLRIAEALNKYLASDRAVDPSFTTNVSPDYRPSPFLPLSFRDRPAVWFALAASVLVIISVVTWLAIQSGRQHNVQPLQAQEPQPTPTVDRQQPSPGVPGKDSERVGENPEHPGATPKPKGKPTIERTVQKDDGQSNPFSSSSSLAFAIYPGGISRSETQTNRLLIPSEVDSVLLKLPVRAMPHYASYSAALRSRGRMIRHWPKLPTEVDRELGKIVKVDVATTLLNKQRYEIRLAGFPADSRPPENYYFWVDKK
jgi:hypothetical protein